MRGYVSSMWLRGFIVRDNEIPNSRYLNAWKVHLEKISGTSICFGVVETQQ